MHPKLACVEQMVDGDVRLADIETYIEAGVRPRDRARRRLWLSACNETNRHERRLAVSEFLARTAHELGAQQPEVRKR